MRLPVIFLIVAVCAGCAGPASSDTSAVPTSAAAPSTSVSSVPDTTTTTTQPPPPCPPAPYELAVLPAAVVAADDDTLGEPDEFTSIGGTHTRLWVGADGAVAIALVRGSLPPNQFPAERGEVDVAGSRGVAGPYPDGRWVVAWFNEPGDRCDEYTMVFYPPVAPTDVEATLEGMVRVPG